MTVIEIIAIGREILTGTTQDSNSCWLAREIFKMGGRVSRFSAVDDDVADIACSIKEALRRRAQCIISTGGLGPTCDDQTMEGVAEATGLKLEINESALSFVKRRYSHFFRLGYVDNPELNPPRKKMALFPAGAEMLRNPVGTAPAMSLRYGDCRIISLPGVPAEMKAIFEGAVRRLLRGLLAGNYQWWTRFHSGLGDESAIAEIIQHLTNKYEGVRVKPHPQTFGEEISIEIEITAEGKTNSEARRKGERVEKELRKFLGTGKS